MSSYPSIYFKLLKNRLIPPGELKAAVTEFCEKIAASSSSGEKNSVGKRLDILYRDDDSSENEASFLLATERRRETETHSDETDFILDNEDETDSTISSLDSETPAEADPRPEVETIAADELDKKFLAELELEGLLNHWQVTQLLHARTRFHLGQYRIVDSLGAGGYGYVFLARTKADPSNVGVSDSSGRRPYDVAVKVLPRSESNPRRLARFLREIEINRQLNHPNIVRFIDAAEDGKVHFAVYEYMDGKTARQLDHQTIPVDGPTAGYVIYETAKALFYLHQKGFIHRDIKPGNILFSKEGDVKLGDLGLATSLVGGSFTPRLGSVAEAPDELDASGRQIAGTSDYLSPDQIRHPTRPNLLWDIYSLGCAFYFLVTGIVPFPSGSAHQKLSAHLKSDAPDPKMFNQGLSWELSRLIREMMDKDPKKRPVDAEEVCRRLKPHIGTKNDLKEFLKRRKSVDKINKLVFPKKEFNWNELFTDDSEFLAVVNPFADGKKTPHVTDSAPKTTDSAVKTADSAPNVTDSDVKTAEAGGRSESFSSSNGERPENGDSSRSAEIQEMKTDEFSVLTDAASLPESPFGEKSAVPSRTSGFSPLATLSVPPVLPLDGTDSSDSADSPSSLIDSGESLRPLEKRIRFYEATVTVLKWSLIPLAAAFLVLLFFWRTRS